MSPFETLEDKNKILATRPSSKAVGRHCNRFLHSSTYLCCTLIIMVAALASSLSLRPTTSLSAARPSARRSRVVAPVRALSDTNLVIGGENCGAVE